MKMLNDSCIRDLHTKGMNKSRSKHVVSRFRRALSMNISIKIFKKSNVLKEFKIQKTVNSRKGADKVQRLNLARIFP